MDSRQDSVFCIAPWTSVHLMPTGKLYPCCMFKSKTGVGDIRKESLSTLWNAPRMRKLRANMMAGKEDPGCRDCYNIAKVDGHGLREHMNKQFASHFQRIRDTSADGTFTEGDAVYVDFRFSNLCNFRCRICNPTYSSKWYEDYKALWGNEPYDGRVLKATDKPEDLWREFSQLIPNMEEIYFAGGEPLILDEHYQILDHLIKEGKTDTRLAYVSNFSTLKHRKWDVIDYWRKFSNITISASLDAPGMRGEYIRKGQDWQRIVGNLQRLKRECPHVIFIVQCTFSIYNADMILNFYRFFEENEFIIPGNFNINFLQHPKYLNAQILPLKMRKRLIEEYTEFLQTLRSRNKPQNYSLRFESGLEAAINFLKLEMPASADERRKFQRYTWALDGIRAERFKRVFPELSFLMKDLRRPLQKMPLLTGEDYPFFAFYGMLAWQFISGSAQKIWAKILWWRNYLRFAGRNIWEQGKRSFLLAYYRFNELVVNSLPKRLKRGLQTFCYPFVRTVDFLFWSISVAWVHLHLMLRRVLGRENIIHAYRNKEGKKVAFSSNWSIKSSENAMSIVGSGRSPLLDHSTYADLRFRNQKNVICKHSHFFLLPRMEMEAKVGDAYRISLVTELVDGKFNGMPKLGFHLRDERFEVLEHIEKGFSVRRYPRMHYSGVLRIKNEATKFIQPRISVLFMPPKTDFTLRIYSSSVEKIDR